MGIKANKMTSDIMFYLHGIAAINLLKNNSTIDYEILCNIQLHTCIPCIIYRQVCLFSTIAYIHQEFFPHYALRHASLAEYDT